MRIANHWNQYRILDTSGLEKLEYVKIVRYGLGGLIKQQEDGNE